MDLLFDTLIMHTSTRSFKKDPIRELLKTQLLTAASSGSTSNFLQAYSIIEVKDPSKLNTIETISRCPGYVADAPTFYIFLADLNRHATILEHYDQPINHLASEETLLVSVIDAVIAAENMAVYAESKGLGICYIGGIRNDLFKMASLLDLPKYTVPLFGLSIGYPQESNEVKPRLPKSMITSTDHYQPLDFDQLAAYDEEISNYYQKRSHNKQQTNWSQKVQDYFSQERRPELKAFLKKQGFQLG